MTRPFQFIAGSRPRGRPGETGESRPDGGGDRLHALCVHNHLAPQLGPIPMLTAVAMAMTQLRVCPLVLNNDFRHPAVLGQDLATLDIVSDGRLDVGIAERVKRTHSRCRARC